MTRRQLQRERAAERARQRDITPLIEAMKVRLLEPDWPNRTVTCGYSIETGAQLAGLSERNWVKTINRGVIAEAVADRACTAMGIHPCEVWPDYFDIDNEQDIAA